MKLYEIFPGSNLWRDVPEDTKHQSVREIQQYMASVRKTMQYTKDPKAQMILKKRLRDAEEELRKFVTRSTGEV